METESMQQGVSLSKQHFINKYTIIIRTMYHEPLSHNKYLNVRYNVLHTRCQHYIRIFMNAFV